MGDTGSEPEHERLTAVATVSLGRPGVSGEEGAHRRSAAGLHWIWMVVATLGAIIGCAAFIVALLWAAGAEERQARQVAEEVIRSIYQPAGEPPAGRMGHWDVEFPTPPQVQKCFPVREGGGALWRVVGEVRGRTWQAPPPPGEADPYRVSYYCGLEAVGGGQYRIWQVVLDGSSESRLEGKLVGTP